MKRITNILTALLIVIGTVANANTLDSVTASTGNNTLRVRNTSQNLYKVIYRSNSAQTVKINLRDNKNRVLHSERVSTKTGFAKPFDLSLLPAGEYVVEVISGTSVEREVINKASVKELYNGLVEVSKLDNNKKVRLDIAGNNHSFDFYIVSESGEVIYDETTSTSKIYNLEKVAVDNVNILVYKNGQVIASSAIKF